ncbi:cation-transporting ATPase I [Streptomyces sp. SAI-170]|uniref:cation-translocating P-type ATPase n=1 Tax=Streptomyces sp. SAI-170 TaxID=3377729 RepID=UPI003C7A196D
MGLITGTTAAVLAGPRLLACGAVPAAGAAVGAAAGAARAGVRGADSAVRVARVARNALPGGERSWRSGRRAHLALEPTAPAQVHRAGGTQRALRKTAAALAERPEVAYAYWDGGLRRLVVAAVDEAVADRVVERATDLAARHGLSPAGGGVEEFSHPGDPAGVRYAAAALAADVAGAAVAVTARALRLPPTPRTLTATVSVLRENPAFRGLLRSRLGRSRSDLLLAVAHAAARGAGQSSTSLLLAASLRALQLGETVARAAAFDADHDRLCVPGREDVAADRWPRPPLRSTPAEDYAGSASAGRLLGAAAALLVKRDTNEAAEAALAGSPKAARYGPAAFHAVLGCALARTGVLVRDTDRLRQLETAGTLLLHPSALCRQQESGEDVCDPWGEAVLDAARRAGMRVVVVDDPVVGELTGLADQVVEPGRPLADVVAELREPDGTVVTVARPRSADDEDVLSGLLAGDIAVALTDPGAAVAWGADVLAVQGLVDVWRLLVAVPAARRVGDHAQVLAKSGAALSGLLVAIGESPHGRRRRGLAALRDVPVETAAAASLFSGVRAALGVAVTRAPHPRPRVAWHALETDAVLSRLEQDPGVRPEGLARTADRVRTRARSVGRTPVLAPARWTLSLARAVRGELDDPLTPILAVGSAAEAILGSAVDAFLVLGALDLNALVGGAQRLRAEHALSKLVAEQKQKARLAPREEAEAGQDTGAPPSYGTAPEDEPADALRTVDASRLAPGDVIDLRADDVVPADARLLWQDGLEVDESALTGESLPADKQTDATPRATVADRHCMVFEGTTVVAGRARAVVVDTGAHTEAHRAVALAARTPPSAGVQARLRELTEKALPMTLAGGAAVSGLALLRGTPIREAVSGGVAVAVAAVPEGLPLVATVAQLTSARRLSRRGVLVRTPRTLEALGRMDTLCFDKTGTLTENRLRLVRVSDAAGSVHRPGEDGADPTLRAAARACPRLDGGDERPAHATDEAVLDAAGPDPEWEQSEGRPFEAARGYAAAVGRAADGSPVLVVKGAPETVLPACRALPDDASDRAHRLARDGLRVLAVAERSLSEGESAADVLEEPLQELEFTGLLGLADTPRETSTALVEGLSNAGVRPVMLTGDHPQTARAIAAELGWPEDTVVVTGEELAAADRSVRARMLRDAGVVARVAPEQKLQVIEALRDAGLVVGMVGDGANDAAAIRAADVGVGIQARGSAAARNAADIVLTGDDLTVLIEAVGEGRALWHGVADAVAILIGGNAGEVGFGILGTLLSGAAPLSTRQMLLVNLFTDLFPAMAVAVTPKGEESGAEDGVPEPGPQPLGTSLLGAPLIRQIRHRALTTCLGATAAWLFGRFTPGTRRRSTTMALCALVGTQLAQTLADRRGSPLVRATAIGSAAALFLLVETPGASQFFGCTPLGPFAWAGVAAAIALAVMGQRALPGLERTVSRLAR